MAEKKTTYYVEIDGQEFTRKTYRTYAYAIVGRFPKDKPGDDQWRSLGWAGRDDLAIKAEARERKWWGEVRAIPAQVRK